MTVAAGPAPVPHLEHLLGCDGEVNGVPEGRVVDKALIDALTVVFLGHGIDLRCGAQTH
jgi:hypothetical protein